MLFVSIATGPALDGHDLAVQPFGHGVRHPRGGGNKSGCCSGESHDGHLLANRLQA
jgi:hypothetical protein